MNVADGPENDVDVSGRSLLTQARNGEQALNDDPGDAAGDAALAFIGHVRSPWHSRAECPKNVVAARETGQAASLHVDEPFRPGLAGLAGFSHAIVLTWFDRAQRNLIVQKPRHALEAKGVFALRSPVRPNPIGLHVVSVRSVDLASGVVAIDAIDVLDGTPVIDIKPYFASVDAVPEATRPTRDQA